MIIDQFICLADNFAVLLHLPASGETIAIDAPDAAAIAARLDGRGWRLSHILTTHHHRDHTGGNLELKQRYGCSIIGPAAERDRIPGLDAAVAEGAALTVAGEAVTVLDTPGHTAGHISFVFPERGLAFVGDTLFSLGCGRLLEGDAATMWRSLDKLRQLPRETSIYCGHEYTEANARFALTIEPNNLDLAARAEQVSALRAAGEPALPTTLGEELKTNPFLRADNRRVKRVLEMEDAPPAAVFAEIRRRKDAFR